MSELQYPLDTPGLLADLYRRPDNGLPRIRTGKVAIIRDVAAVTCVKSAAI